MTTKNLNIAALVTGVVSILFSLLSFVLFFFGFIAPIVAIVSVVLSGMGLSKSKAAGEPASGMAIAGLVLGIVSLVLAIPMFFCAICACQILAAGAGALNDLQNALNGLY